MSAEATTVLERPPEALSPQAAHALRQSLRRVRPTIRLSRVEWAERHRTVATGARTGPFRWRIVPALKGVMAACDDPRVSEVVVLKPSQIGYTVSVLLNLLGFHIHQDPASILVLFPKDGAAKKFNREKLEPTIDETPVLAERINTKSRNSDNTQEYKGFDGGFIQLSGVNSPSNFKSTDARIGCVEEPDDVGHDIKGQGDPISHIKARTKTFYNRLLLIGGSPTLEDFSAIARELKLSDRRQCFVRCPHCGHRQVLRWEQVEWLKEADVQHPVYGTHRPETARYLCEDEECGALWTDYEKNQALLECEWEATAPFSGVAGFDLSTGGELYSAIPESRMELLVRRYLEAKHEKARGDDAKMREFYNGTLGRPWRIKADTPEIEQLVERVEDYPEWTVPAGGLVAVASVDVQRGGEYKGEPRLEYLVRVFGRDMESWKATHDVILGNPLEPHVWDKLEQVMSRTVRNLAGGELPIRALSIDSSDGMTSEAVYRFARKHRKRGVMAVKGWNETGNRQKEIFSRPQSIDHTHADKAARWGLRVYMVGTAKAKDVIHGRLKLEGDGPGRMHFNAGTGEEYFKQLTAEAKIPGRSGRLVWTKKAGQDNEALDLEVMCLHAAHKLKLHTWNENQWRTAEEAVRQPDLLEHRPAKAKRKGPQKPSGGSGFGSEEWQL